MINKENLLKLAEFLWQRISQDQFDIAYYRAITEENGKRKTFFHSHKDCGTIGCVLGWSPFVEGLEPIDIEFKFLGKLETIDIGFKGNSFLLFPDYSERIFGEHWPSLQPLSFIFSSYWGSIDNTVEGAVQRILYVCKFYEPEELSDEEIEELFEISKEAVGKYKDINPAEFFGERLSNPFKQ